MNRRLGMCLMSVLYFLSLLSLSVMAFYILDVVKLSHSGKLFAGVFAVLTGYAAGYLRAFFTKSETRRRKIIKEHLVLIFAFYIGMLIDFTLIDDAFGRNIFNFLSWNKEAFKEYINTSTNLVPFETVRIFIKGYEKGVLPLSATFENIFGNIFAFMPIPFFLKCLFKGYDKWYKILLTIVLSVLAVELLQLLLLTGSADIDDLILNTLGAMALYGILKIKVISAKLEWLTFGVWKRNEV